MKKAGKKANTNAKNVTNSLISVIIPVYNVEGYIGKCLRSIIDQTYRNLEIIIIDDGSNDNSGKICENYAQKDARIKVIHQSNGGIAKARNTGIENATADYICFIDSDDYVEKKYIETLFFDLIQRQADISMVKHVIEYPNTILPAYTKQKYTMSAKECLEKLLYDNDVDTSMWGKLFKKELFDDIAFPEGKIFEDHAVFYRTVMQAKKISLNSTPLYHYVKAKDLSITNSDFDTQKMDLISITQQMQNDISSVYPELSIACKRRTMWAYLSTLVQTTKTKHPPKEIIQQLMNYIHNNRSTVINDPQLPKRDQIALKITKYGYSIFKTSWRIYQNRRAQ